MRNMTNTSGRREMICLLAIVVLSVCVCILSYQLYEANVKKVSMPAPIPASDARQVIHENAYPAPLFYVAVRDGAVRAQDLTVNGAYILLKNIDVRTMRNADRERFETGFYLYSEEELQSLLEDYSS